MPRFNTDHRQLCFGESTEQPLRQRTGFQSNPLEVVGGILQNRQQRFRFARYFHFSNDLACVIHNADAGLLDRHVQSSKMVHAALLLLMRLRPFTRTSLNHQPEAQHPKTSAIHKLQADYPIFWHEAPNHSAASTSVIEAMRSSPWCSGMSAIRYSDRSERACGQGTTTPQIKVFARFSGCLSGSS